MCKKNAYGEVRQWSDVVSVEKWSLWTEWPRQELNFWADSAIHHLLICIMSDSWTAIDECVLEAELSNPKIFRNGKQQVKAHFPVRYCMLQDILVTSLLIISKELQLQFWEWWRFCIQRWMYCKWMLLLCVRRLDHAAQMTLQKNDNARGKMLKQSFLFFFSLHLHADIKVLL